MVLFLAIDHIIHILHPNLYFSLCKCKNVEQDVSIYTTQGF